MKYIARLWNSLTYVFINYAKYFEKRDEAYVKAMEEHLEKLLVINKEAIALLGDKFYCQIGTVYSKNEKFDFVENFVKEVRDSFRAEKIQTEAIEKEQNLVDYVICGGAMESHKLQKEVNFSDTYVTGDSLYRIPGTGRGTSWSTVNTHGWFSYEISVKKGVENTIKLLLGTHLCKDIDIKVTLDGKEYTFSEKTDGNTKEVSIPYKADKDVVRIRFDRFTANTPCVHNIRVYAE